MIALSLKQALFIGLVIVLAVVWLVIQLERQRQQRALHSLSADDLKQLRVALEAAPMGLVILDLQNSVRYANARARQLLGLSETNPALPAAAWRAELEQDLHAARQPGVLQAHYRTLPLLPDMMLSWWICPLPHLNLIVLTDISRQHKAEQTARVFLGNLSHELRTPLTALLTHLAVLRAPNVPEAARQTSLDIIQQETSRMARLVPALLELSRLEISEPIHLRPVDLILVAEEAIAQVILEAEARGINLTFETASPLPRVLGDSDRLKQVFLNLLDNALKYCRAGDKIEVTLCPQPGGVRATFRDTGPGIPAEHLPNVAQRFYRARTDVTGSGLGLALVQEILRHHHSQLEIESHTNGADTGTTLHFVLAAEHQL
jgi:two-component system phosphate regulon sensor histidine kinase PhoR